MIEKIIKVKGHPGRPIAQSSSCVSQNLLLRVAWKRATVNEICRTETQVMFYSF